ncbi:MAG TPA: cyclic nucleotide-binding domain-containing protein [Thermoanaerobaculia bacterium]|nr:cyclic nucleotide-binding domain-containing protein [Thermoanaerobaculia bacterium]
MDLADRLKRWDAFSHFTRPQLDALGDCVALARYPAGVSIVSEGDATADAYLIDSGRIRIRRQTAYGDYTLATLSPGDLFGETSFVDRNTRSGDALAEETTQLLGFNPATLRPLLDRDRRLAIALYWTFWKSLSRKLRSTNARLDQFFIETARPADATELSPGAADGGEFRVDLASKRKLFAEQRLSSLEINFLSTLSQERKLAPGEILFREGDLGDEMYVLLDGRVMIYKYIQGAGEEALAFLERGDYFGEMALIDGEPRSADARADEGGAVVLAISGEVLSGILDLGKVSSLPLLKILCGLVAKRLRELDDKLVGWFILAGGGEASTPSPP